MVAAGRGGRNRRRAYDGGMSLHSRLFRHARGGAHGGAHGGARAHRDAHAARTHTESTQPDADRYSHRDADATAGTAG